MTFQIKASFHPKEWNENTKTLRATIVVSVAEGVSGYSSTIKEAGRAVFKFDGTDYDFDMDIADTSKAISFVLRFNLREAYEIEGFEEAHEAVEHAVDQLKVVLE